MPTLTTQVVVNDIQTSAIQSIMIKITNNSSKNSRCYFQGSSINGSKILFAEELFSIAAGQVVTRQYNYLPEYFQFDFVTSQDQLAVQVFAMNHEGAVSIIPIVEKVVERITSDFRDNVIVTADDTAVISFRRNEGFSIPSGVAAAVWPEGANLLTNSLLRYKIVAGGTVDGSFVPFPTATTQLAASETSLLVNDTCSTVTGGNVIFQGTATGLSGAYLSTDISLVNNELLYYLTDLEPITLVVSTLGGDTANIAGVFRVLEGW